MACEATVKLLVVNVALPLLIVTLAAMMLEPSMKVTLPVGVPGRPLTVAVNVTDWL